MHPVSGRLIPFEMQLIQSMYKEAIVVSKQPLPRYTFITHHDHSEPHAPEKGITNSGINA